MAGWSFTNHPLRLIGDIMHLASFLILFLKIKSRHSCSGISLKTQEIYAVVFLARYLDLFTNHLSLYLTIMKLIFISSTLYIIYLMRYQYKKTYSRNEDAFPKHWLFLVLPCFVLGLFINESFTFFEIMWASSIYLEAVAILPQLYMLIKFGETVELLTSHYIATLGAYRAFYLLNWIYRALTEDDYSQWIVWIAGTIQTGLYIDFFYEYLKSYWFKKKMRLPTTK